MMRENGVPMVQVRNFLLSLLLTNAVLALSAGAQTTGFLPEVVLYRNLRSDLRLEFQAKDTRENGDPTEAEVGPSLDLFLKPLLRLKRITLYDLDRAKARELALSFGYRYVPTPGTPAVNRVILQAQPNLPIKGKLLLSDYSRGELNFSNGALSWRYRNRLTVERALTIHSYHPIPYASSEFYYDSNYRKWSSTELSSGALLPVGKHAQFDLYYEHENNTGKKPNQQVNAVGLVLNLYF
jgi:hypothetical protein